MKSIYKQYILNSFLFWSLILLVFYLPASILFLPVGVDAMGWGLFSLTVSKSGSIFTLAPYYSDIHTSYPPGFFILTAFFYDLWNIPIPTLMIWISHFMGFTIIGLSYTLGTLLRDRIMGFIFAITALLDSAIYGSLIDTGYTAVLGLIMIFTFLIFFILSIKKNIWFHKILSGLALTGLCFSTPDLLFIVVFVLIVCFISFVFIKEAHRKQITLILFQICLIGFILSLPWSIKAALMGLKPEPQNYVKLLRTDLLAWQPGWHQLGTLLTGHNPLIWIPAIYGIGISLKRRNYMDIMMITWLLVLFDLVCTNVWPTFFGFLGIDIDRFVYFSAYAWRGPILPYIYFSSLAIYTIMIQSKDIFDRILTRHLVHFISICIGCFIWIYLIYKLNVNYNRHIPIPIYIFIYFMLVLINFLFMESVKGWFPKSSIFIKIKWKDIKPLLLFCLISLISVTGINLLSDKMGKIMVNPYSTVDKIDLWYTTNKLTEDIFNPPINGMNTRKDYEAMIWMKNNIPKSSIILNLGTYHQHWVIPVSERKAVFFRDQPFFVGRNKYVSYWDEGWHAYRNPNSDRARVFFKQHKITHLFLPENEESVPFEETPILELVYQNGNAKIYQITTFN